ncbi:MAG: L-2-hydroxyglutarate oxidase [Balneolaceae bacterium]
MKYDITVVGAGIVGLAAAWKLSKAWPDARILILEKEDRVAVHQTGRNSGVLHSGIYYKPGSYRARNCVDGRHQMVQFCKEHGVSHEICGKLVVATREEELSRLEAIYERGLRNGIEGIEVVGPERIREIEPWTAGIRAIRVPCAGIVDFSGVCHVLESLLRDQGAEIRFGQKVTGITRREGVQQIHTEKDSVETGYLVSCAGLYSDRVARSAGLNPGVQIVPFRGEYFELVPEAAARIRGLIYPLPNPEFPFLGVHYTRMALGGVECGPNAVFAFKREGYEKLSFDLDETLETLNYAGFWRLAKEHWRMGLGEYRRSLSRNAFVGELRRLMPWIQSEHLHPAPSGVRAMALNPDGTILDDFLFESQEGQLHVLNAPSPAATAALSIADEIVRRAEW